VAGWQGCTELGAGEAAGPRYVTGLGGQAARRAGPRAPGLHAAVKDGGISAVPRHAASKTQSPSALGQVWASSVSVGEENPERKAVGCSSSCPFPPRLCPTDSPVTRPRTAAGGSGEPRGMSQGYLFLESKLHTAGWLPGSCRPALISPFDQTTLD